MSKRKAANLQEKYELIKQIEFQTETQQQISVETGIPRSTIAIWCGQEKAKIVEAYERNVMSSARKRLRFSKYENRKKILPYEKIDECLFEWFKDKRQNNAPSSGQSPRLCSHPWLGIQAKQWMVGSMEN